MKPSRPLPSLVLPFFLFFLGLFLAFSVKTFLIPFILILLSLFFIYRFSLIDSVYLTLVLALPFETAIRQWQLFGPSSPDVPGYHFFFAVTPKLVLTGLLLALALVRKNRPRLKPSVNYYLFLGFLLISCLGSVLSPRPDFVAAGLVRLLVAAAIYFFTAAFFSHPRRQSVFRDYLLSLTLFAVFFGVFQLLKQQPLGRFIELTPAFYPAGYTTTDGLPQFRVPGFLSHPVYFGAFLSMLLPPLISLTVRSKKRSYLWLTLLTLIVILGTLSRSAWINLLLVFFGFYLYLRPGFVLPKLAAPAVLGLLALLTFVIPLTLTRLTTSLPDLADPRGSVSSRLNLAAAAVSYALSNPLTGIGLNNFSLLNFTAPPHNTLLIFAAELGIPAAVLFALFIFNSLFQNPSRLTVFNFGIWLSLLTFVVSSQFHPLFNLDPTFDLFMLILGYFAVCRPLPD